MNLCPDENGSVLALFVIFLPAALLIMALVLDIGAFMGARQAAKAACDLGALAALQEIDWDALAEGTLLLLKAEAEQKAFLYARENAKGSLAENALFSAKASVVDGEPTMEVEGRGVSKVAILSLLPKYKEGVPYRVMAKAQVTLRTIW